MPSDCFVFFDHPDGVFYTGSNVSGRFELTTRNRKMIRGVWVQITGTANVCWEVTKTVRENDRNVEQITEYRNDQTYLNFQRYVIGSEYSELFELDEGVHEYTFDCALPPNLPSSFTGTFGEIVYQVTVEIDRADVTYNNRFTQGFTVVYSLDLNLSAEYRLAKSLTLDETYGCCKCLCGSGKIEATLTIPQNAFVAGQNIPFTILITNDSSNEVDAGSTVKLIRYVSYTANTPEVDHKTKEIVLDEKTIETETLRFSKKEFKNILEIPSTPPTTLPIIDCCIKIEYTVAVQIITPFCASNINLVLPITMGSIPFTDEHNEVITVQPTAPRWEDTAVGSVRNLDLPPGYHTMSPPSYEFAAKLIREDFEKRQKSMHNGDEYTPRYPMFNQRIPAPPYTEE